jgi:hypothetical protein
MGPDRECAVLGREFPKSNGGAGRDNVRPFNHEDDAARRRSGSVQEVTAVQLELPKRGYGAMT